MNDVLNELDFMLKIKDKFQTIQNLLNLERGKMTISKDTKNPLGPGYNVSGSEMRYRDAFNKTLRDELIW